MHLSRFQGPNRRRRQPGLIASLRLLGLLSLAASLSTAQPHAAAASPISQISNRTGLNFPTGARLLFQESEDNREPYVQAILQLPKGALHDFLATNHLSEQQCSKLNQGFLPVDNGAWDPSAKGPLPVCTRDNKDGTYLYVGYIDSSAGARLYVYWLST